MYYDCVAWFYNYELHLLVCVVYSQKLYIYSKSKLNLYTNQCIEKCNFSFNYCSLIRTQILFSMFHVTFYNNIKYEDKLFVARTNNIDFSFEWQLIYISVVYRICQIMFALYKQKQTKNNKKYNVLSTKFLQKIFRGDTQLC